MHLKPQKIPKKESYFSERTLLIELNSPLEEILNSGKGTTQHPLIISSILTSRLEESA